MQRTEALGRVPEGWNRHVMVQNVPGKTPQDLDLEVAELLMAGFDEHAIAYHLEVGPQIVHEACNRLVLQKLINPLLRL